LSRVGRRNPRGASVRGAIPRSRVPPYGFYDELDRLTSATAAPPPGNYGSAVYAYDAFDNLRRYQLGTRDRRYQYSDGSGRLTRLTQADNLTSVEEYGYDTRGNLQSTLPAGSTTTTT